MEQLQSFRNEIDTIDGKLIELLWQRFDYVRKVAVFKKENKMPVLQSNRWQEVLGSAKKSWIENGLNPVFVWVVWNTIHEFALEVEGIITNNN